MTAMTPVSMPSQGAKDSEVADEVRCPRLHHTGTAPAAIRNNPLSTVSCAHRRWCTHHPQVWSVLRLAAPHQHPSYVQELTIVVIAEGHVLTATARVRNLYPDTTVGPEPTVL
ncbi:hypothetical protein KTU01_31580 [Kocuria turfanensis]|uniref:Uncharacterized protein n=1 Tax=Kocuria turfanensis TaxID=388357 RepID=A0A512IH50_9MICC|nr:hypothetical protein KTU01_31580 [Kocuria turfanensis]